MCKKIFISYATPDREIVEEFIRFLQLVDGIERAEVYYAGKNEGEIPSGVHFINDILDNIRSTEYTIALLSEHYAKSFNCAMEIGASLCIKEQNKHILLTIPPYSNENVPTLLKGIQIEGSITDERTLLNLKEDLIEHINAKSAKTEVWSQKANETAAKFKEIAKAIPRPNMIKKEDYDELVQQHGSVKKALEDRTQEVSSLEKKVSDLTRLKDKEEVRKVEQKYNDLESQFDDLTNEINREFRTLSSYIIEIIYCHYAGTQRVESFDLDQERADYSNAVQRRYIDEDGKLNTAHPKISKILRKLDDLRDFLEKHVDACFIQDICENQECEPYLTDRTFWDYFFS